MSIATAIFEGDELAQAIGVPVYYGFVEAVVVSLYCIWAWKNGWTKAPADVTLWQALTTSYEVKALDQVEQQPDSGIQLPKTGKKSTSGDGAGWDYVDYGDAGKEPKTEFIDYEQAEKDAANTDTKPSKTGGWFGGLL